MGGGVKRGGRGNRNREKEFSEGTRSLLGRRTSRRGAVVQFQRLIIPTFQVFHFVFSLAIEYTHSGCVYVIVAGTGYPHFPSSVRLQFVYLSVGGHLNNRIVF